MTPSTLAIELVNKAVTLSSGAHQASHVLTPEMVMSKVFDAYFTLMGRDEEEAKMAMAHDVWEFLHAESHPVLWYPLASNRATTGQGALRLVLLLRQPTAPSSSQPRTPVSTCHCSLLTVQPPQRPHSRCWDRHS